MEKNNKTSNDSLKNNSSKYWTGLIYVSAALIFFLSVNCISSVNNSTFVKLKSTQVSGPGVPWKAPESADALKNPYKGNAAETAKGKTLYLQLCAACHGNSGKGDGAAAVALNPRPADHTSSKVQNQSDGALFWKMTNGNPPMAPYKDVLTEDQRWDLVNFIRTLKK